MEDDKLRTEQYWVEHFAEMVDFDYEHETAPGDVCLYIAESLESQGIKDFQIISGYVWPSGYQEGIRPTPHPWIEFNDKTIIDLFSLEWFGLDSDELERVDSYCRVLAGNGLYEFFENEYYTAKEYSIHLRYG